MPRGGYDPCATIYIAMTLFRLQNEKLARDNLDTAIELVEAPIWSSISEIDTAVELVEDQNGASSDGSPRAPVSWEDKIGPRGQPLLTRCGWPRALAPILF